MIGGITELMAGRRKVADERAAPDRTDEIGVVARLAQGRHCAAAAGLDQHRGR